MDEQRALTHNKGVMNGVSAVALATGNDLRALEGAVHFFAGRTGRYLPLTHFSADQEALRGEIKLPVPLGVKGGFTQSHPCVKMALQLANVSSSAKLGKLVACVGLAQNLAALLALTGEGLMKGHLAYHHRKFVVP